jgi:hypothetical protein
MRSPFGHAGWLLGGTAAVLLGIVTGLGAQDQLINDSQIEQFKGKLEFAYKTKVLTGQEQAPKEQGDLAARYYVSRVTHVPITGNPVAMAQVVKDFETMVSIAVLESNVSKNRDAVAKLVPPLVQRFKEVFELEFMPNRVAIVNAAVMLPSAARLKQEEIGDFLTSLINDPKKHDAIRVHALKGLREYFPARAYTKLDLNQATTKQLVARKDRDIPRVDALLKVIDRPMPPTKDPLEIDAFRYIRREAVASLADVQVPAITAFAKLEAPVALGLVKILAKKVTPEPTVHERLEAAIGVCQLKARDIEEYDARIGIYLVGVLLTDLVSEYKKDLINIQQPMKTRKPTYLPWKVDSRRLEAGLSDMARFTGTAAGPNADAQKLEAAARPILKAMSNGEGIEREQDLRKLVQGLKPKTGTPLFKNAKGPILDFEFEPAVEAQ